MKTVIREYRLYEFERHSPCEHEYVAEDIEVVSAKAHVEAVECRRHPEPGIYAIVRDKPGLQPDWVDGKLVFKGAPHTVTLLGVARHAKETPVPSIAGKYLGRVPGIHSGAWLVFLRKETPTRSAQDAESGSPPRAGSAAPAPSSPAPASAASSAPKAGAQAQPRPSGKA